MSGFRRKLDRVVDQGLTAINGTVVQTATRKQRKPGARIHALRSVGVLCCAVMLSC